ncbi:uncharacterized protein LOC111716525 isoform X2 [Eurytemora carolleeae]|uniref:uncharacterized protein LOC111716525 isoform X2 n=1 Tax=Eurytemora carolleeae TaxID=1294199 RepID=UPI000C785B25|nr:uncharacterized protein LOC111716525 isoform X2 [Eurytemora carolleeae]|eukprot:XP_023347786.1 uncharacterized protein LOC111716525 isoform X2 [Eurytemora affinis]
MSLFEDLAITLLFVLMSVCLSVPLLLLPQLQNILPKQIRKIEEDIQKPSKKSVDIQDTRKKSVDNQDTRRKSVDIQDTRRKSVDIQDISRKSVCIQDTIRKSVDIQDTSRKSVDIKDTSRKSIDIQDTSRKSVDIQDTSRKSVDIQDPSRKSVDNQDRSRKSVDIQDISRKSVDIHDTSRKSVDIQDSSRKSVDVQKNISKLKSDKKLNPTSAAFENLRPILCKKSEEIRKADAETDKNHEFWLVDKDIIKKQFGNHFQKRGINHPEINEKVFHSKQKRRCSEPNTLINTENRKVIKVINFVAITLGEAASKPSITPARSAQNTFKSKHIDFPQKREYKENRIDFRTEEKMLKVNKKEAENLPKLSPPPPPLYDPKPETQMSPSIQPDITKEDLNNTLEDKIKDISCSIEESPKFSRQPVKHDEPESVIKRRRWSMDVEVKPLTFFEPRRNCIKDLYFTANMYTRPES